MILRSTRVVLPDAVCPASIHVENGVVTRIGAFEESREAPEPGIVSPGLVDTHVHVNEPGRTEWEGFDTATRAAAAGGVTTIVDMPLNSVPPTTSAAALEAKRAAARGRAHVDVAFWGGVVPGNAGELDALVDAGVRGFKCFLVPSGVDEFPAVDEEDLRAALPILARRSVPLLVHAEDPRHLVAMRPAFSAPAATHPTDPAQQAYQTYLASRPPEAERAAIAMMIRLSREFGVHVHIVHVACAEGVDEIARAKSGGVQITAETCPHYLTFAAEEIPAGATAFKCAPPIREARHRDALRAGLRSGALDLVATDHSPAPPAMKCPGNFVTAWGGIASLELSLAAVWSSAMPDAGQAAKWMSEAPAALAGFGARKGRIAPGFDADLVVWDPDAEWTVDPLRLQQRHKLTPYAGRALRGAVRSTYVRGVVVYENGEIVRAPAGTLL